LAVNRPAVLRLSFISRMPLLGAGCHISNSAYSCVQMSSTLANLGGAWRGTRLRRVRPSGVLLHPSGTGICGKSGDAREGPSAEVIIAAQDGYKGRLAPAWEMCKARPPTPSEPLQLVYQRGAGCVGSPQNWPKSRVEDVLKGPSCSWPVLPRSNLRCNPDRSRTTEREQRGLGDQAQSKTPCLGGRLRARGSLSPWVGPPSY
jgi:hypothetical protein